MVTNVTSLTGNGLRDWLLQRVSAVYLAVYFGALFFYLLSHHPMSYPVWHDFFHGLCVQLATSVSVIMMITHAWIGIWTVTTDYIKCTVFRLSVQMLVGLLLVSLLIWGFFIIWGH